jgi:hypothetical protein
LQVDPRGQGAKAYIPIGSRAPRRRVLFPGSQWALCGPQGRQDRQGQKGRVLIDPSTHTHDAHQGGRHGDRWLLTRPMPHRLHHGLHHRPCFHLCFCLCFCLLLLLPPLPSLLLPSLPATTWATTYHPCLGNPHRRHLPFGTDYYEDGRTQADLRGA